ncbi:hypothetical protein [Nitrincola sp. MINF-07-Sa-05]|uniref:hypothetical protein n=1 Tax=Nitrincola salilacus TaxID=3400273 RepID=UPI003918052D
MRLMTAIAAVGLSISVAQADLSGTDAYGVYLQSTDGYVAAENLDSFYGFGFDASASMMTMPVVERSDEKLEIVIHHPDFYPSHFEMEIRPVDMAAARNSQKHSVTPLGDDRYKITVNESIADGNVVLLNLNCCFGGVHGAMLGDPVDALKVAFAQGSDQNPAGAEQSLGRITRAVPDNAELAELHAYWETRLAQREATRHFEFVESIWARYESAEGSEARIDALRHVLAVTEAFLNDHPLALDKEKEQVQSMHKQAEERLNI